MKSYNKIQRLLSSAIVAVIAFWATLTGCTTTADYTLGEEFAPGHQQLEMRYRLYKGGMLQEKGAEDTPCKVFETRLYRTDSVSGGSLSNLYLGLQNHNRYGTRKMGFASQYLFMTGVDDSMGFGYRPVYDSMMFLFKVDTFAGDTTKPIKYNVYALTADLVNEQSEDSVFIVTYDPRTAGHLAADAQPIYTFEYPNPAKGIYTTSKMLRMQETPHTKEFLNKLLCLELDENGLANSNTEFYQTDSAFVHNFPGLFIEPAEDMPEGEGSAFSFEPTSTGIGFYGRMRHPGADTELMSDSLQMNYYFHDDKAQGYGNARAQRVTLDYGASDFASTPMYETEQNRPEVEIGYVDGCGGMITELTFTKEFLYSLYDMVKNDSGEVTHESAALNQAALRIYIEEAEYDYTLLNPITWADKLNHSMSRLGLYLNYKTLTPIPDYMYSVESSGGSLAYNGYVNRSLACYEMNVTSYLQQIINNIIKMAPASSEEIDFEEMNIPPRFYVGPAMGSIFTFNRSAIQGADKEFNPAAIELEVVYTLVK